MLIERGRVNFTMMPMGSVLAGAALALSGTRSICCLDADSVPRRPLLVPDKQEIV